MAAVFRFALFFCLLPSAAPVCRAHPAHATDVSHPYVAGFERFFAAGDDPAYLRQGGELLLSELNCVSCHQAPPALAERFPGSPGPDLRGVASRLQDPAALQIMMRNPRYLKRGTRMPSLFAAADRDPAELDALLHFLSSLDEADGQPLLLGFPERGKEIYHTVGCAACHAPDASYRPPALAEGVEPEPPALPSPPIRLAAYWPVNHLTRYLMNPGKFQPAARMPDFGLTEQEAADVAAYLQAGPELTDPDSRLPEFDPALAQQGRILFQSKGCAACHDLGMAEKTTGAPGLMELRAGDEGCLAELPADGGIPYFYLSNTQRTAIKLALLGLHEDSGSRPDRLTQELMRWDCYACHSYDGRGGPELAREPFFGAGDPRALDRETFLPPPLDDVASHPRKELDEILAGETERRSPKVGARMIRIAPEARKTLIELLLGQSR